jgi:hypothetical protein
MRYKRTLNLLERSKLLCFLMIERQLFLEPGVIYTPSSRTHEHNRFPCTPLAHEESKRTLKWNKEILQLQNRFESAPDVK